jgi:hypothetical protein
VSEGREVGSIDVQLGGGERNRVKGEEAEKRMTMNGDGGDRGDVGNREMRLGLFQRQLQFECTVV